MRNIFLKYAFFDFFRILWKRYIEKMVKIKFYLNDSDWHDYASETMWGRLTSAKGEFILENAPFFVYGVSFKDLIYAVSKDGEIIFEKVIRSSGYSTYRLIPEKIDGEFCSMNELMENLQKKGCKFERGQIGSMPLVVVGIPPDVSADMCHNEIARRKELGELDFEVAHDGHPD